MFDVGPFAVQIRVSYETRFISKEPKLEPKLVSTLSETKKLVSVVSRNSETASFIVLVEQ
jgi:hypothetical protein